MANMRLLTLEKNCCHKLLNAVVAVVVVGAERG